MAEDEQEQIGINPPGEENSLEKEAKDKKKEKQKNKRKRQLLKEVAKADKRGVCYLSRIPPRMDPLKLRQILSQYGEIQRIYLTPENPATQVHRKRVGGFRGQEFSEGWVEFTKKSVAKQVASMLNGEQIDKSGSSQEFSYMLLLGAKLYLQYPQSGRKRSLFYYDLWNVKYLSKFKWDDLTEEIAYKNAIREQKLALEVSAAKRERDFYLSKVDQSRALKSIQERLKKKHKVQQGSGTKSLSPVDQPEVKVIRRFSQTRPVADKMAQTKLSKGLLAGVFGSSSL